MSNGLIDDLKEQYKNGGVLIRLIFINAAVFILVNLVELVFFLFKTSVVTHDCHHALLYNWFAVPADFLNLLMKPWTPITYMFLHDGILHIFFNMLILYFSGRIFLQFMDQKKLFSTYIMGGLCGALFFVISYNLFPIFNQADNLKCAICLGASASVISVLLAGATLVPNYTVNLVLFGPVKLKYIAIFFLILDIVSIRIDNPGGHLAHLGGAFWGWFYIYQYRKGKDFSLTFTRIYDQLTSVFRKKSTIRVSYSSNKKQHKSDVAYNADKLKTQERIDAILDKISKSGYDSLSADEKDFLFRASSDNR